MNTSAAIIAIDQGTTSTRAILFNSDHQILFIAQEEFEQIYPTQGWVEHDPEVIWRTTITVCLSALAEAEQRKLNVQGIGITNQRETTVVWNKKTHQAVYNAIVWQDRRTADFCDELKQQAQLESVIQHKTGLLLDPYFSASKIRWILQQSPELQQQAKNGELAFGTIDSFLIWRLTQGKYHVTDITNASRTSLFNLVDQRWDSSLLALFDIPEAILPTVKANDDFFGEAEINGQSIPILGVAGDQQAASIGQACFTPGEMKSTYGTGCFVLVNTGDKLQFSTQKLLSTIAYQIQGQTHYALEGSIFMAGAIIQWLRDELGIINSAAETETLARSLKSNEGVYLIPAFTGLGAPHWNAKVQATLYGLTRGSGKAAISRAALEAICYQTYDLMAAMRKDNIEIKQLKIDGGMVANQWFCEYLSNILSVPIIKPKILETTALGVSYLVGLQLGWLKSPKEITEKWLCDQEFTPKITIKERKASLAQWQHYITQTIASY